MKQKITIIGYGRFGKLLADMLKKSTDVSVITNQKKVAGGIKKIDYTDLKKSEIVIFSTPISSTESVLKKIKNVLEPGTVVMDVCSVKEYPVQLMKKILPKDINILGTHPMFGPDSAKNGLDGLQMVFCPIRIDKSKYNKLKIIFKNLKLEIVEMTPKEHDKQSAMSLAFVHFVGRGLELKENLRITTLGYKRLLGVSENVKNDSIELFYDMQIYNRYVSQYRKNFLNKLEKLEDNILKNSRKEDNMESLRSDIDEIDKKIFLMLNKRDGIVNKIAKQKNNKKIKVIDKNREQEVIKSKIKMGVDKDYVKKLYKTIFEHSYIIQNKSVGNRQKRRKK